MSAMDPDKQGLSGQRTKSSRIKVLDRKLLSQQWGTLESVTLDYQHSDGSWRTQKREIYDHGHGAAVLLFNRVLRKIVLIRQFRFPVWDIGGDGFILEVPAGIVESDNAHETIRNETVEETGFIIDEPQLLFKAYASPGSVTEQVYYFIAEYQPDMRAGTGGGLVEEGEDIQVLEVDIDEAYAWLGEGKITDAKTIILIQYAKLNLFTSVGPIR